MNTTEQDKQLLLEDLCARLPYGVMIYYESGVSGDEMLTSIDIEGYDIVINGSWNIKDVKPYLRPMKPSEATEQELKEIEVMDPDYHSVDWLNAHHFDYRGLIEKGLALEAPNEMYD